MSPRDRRQVQQFFARVEARVERETALANAPGIRRTARTAAAQRAALFASDLDYLRDRYSAAVPTGDLSGEAMNAASERASVK